MISVRMSGNVDANTHARGCGSHSSLKTCFFFMGLGAVWIRSVAVNRVSGFASAQPEVH